tara:strand:+ start:29433 stop:30380 length:948 start_codon:yes stop_codon:yes gene_type:complete
MIKYACFLIPFLFLGYSVESQELPVLLEPESFEKKQISEGLISKEELTGHLQFLSSDALKGRKTGDPENIIARNYITEYFLSQNLEVVLQPFSFERDSKTYKATNVITTIKGTENPEKYIAITAHFDHTGIGKPIENDSVYNGADDNASGTAALMVMAKYFKENPPKNSLMFIALDAEEMGLQGAKYFVENKDDKNILFNINMDMISRNDANEIYVCGTRFTPSFKNYFSSIPEKTFPITIKMGHDGLDGKDSWVTASDHAHFYKNNIPFLYFGVEDHADYHKPSDEFENIQPEFYHNVVLFILNTIADLDSRIE